MRRLIASVAVIALLIGAAAPAAHAGSSRDVAVGLASFAAFHHLVVGSLLFPRPAVVVHREVVYRLVVAPPPPVAYAAPAPAYPAVVQYPHGRYELRVRGPRYVWVWIPAVPPPPPPFAP
jgi:hypothetical protein